MKKLQKRALVWLLTLAMLVPMLCTAVGPAFAAITNGPIKNMDPKLVEGLIAPSDEVTYNAENGGGIRFATNINLAKFEDLKAFCKQRLIKVITVGTLIAPVDYIEEAGEFSKKALDALDHKTAYLDFKANTKAFYEGTAAPGYDEQFVASIMNVKLENRTRDFAAIGYIQLTLTSATGGKEYFTIYSYDNEDMTLVKKYSANIAEVAEKELQKDSLTEEERAKLSDLAAEEQKLTLDSTVVKDVRVKRNQVFFTYKMSVNTIFNRITYDGANGWRLQSNTKNYNSFKDIGAGQSLSMYMQEGFSDVAVPLTVTQEDGKLIIAAQGTNSHAELSYDTFNLDFCNADGVSLYNVNGMSKQTDGKIKLTGKMNATEAVYGGGERFDTTNQRGNAINLYISDAYDLKNISSSYVAIPLFSTSRGGGMFVNRYEPMSIQFPAKNTADNWQLTLDAEISDCYFYATGEIADVLQAYVDMTGHASLPEEWAQGYIVCRFAPDLVSLGGQSGNGDGQYWYYNIEDIPDYNKYSYSIRVKMTIDNVVTVGTDVTVSWGKNGSSTYTLKDGSTVVNWDGSETYYKYVVSGSTAYFQSVKDSSVRYNSFSELPSNVEYYLGGDSRDRKNLEIGDVLPHKKALTQGGSATYFHYIIEGPNDDFNYNGIKGESYFLRTSSKGGPSGAGIIYVVDSLIKAGMKPTGVILEGVSWYEMNSGGRAKLEEIATYLQEKDIKTLVYSYLGWVTGPGMGSGYKSEYLLSINVYEYDTATGKIKLDENGNPILKKTTTAIPKVDKSDNPDTASDGTQNYLDITNPDAVKWYIDTVWTALLDLGIDGVKIDFCESIPNEGYYKGMKNIGDGYLTYNWHDPSMFEGNEVHHAYPSFLTSVFYAEMEKRAALRDGDTGFMLLTRGGGIGSQRNPYMWAGDQTRRFRTLGLQLKAAINSGISGIPFMSYDMAGYAYYGTSYHYYGNQPQLIEDIIGKVYLADQKAAEEYESEIFIRGLQYTVFGNQIQTHGDVRHLYYMTQEVQDIAALYTSLHEELADYLQKLSKIACDTGMPMIRHMILEYQNDANVASIDDQFMYGDGLLVAPILTANSKVDANGKTVLDYASVITRDVYLPAGEWIDLNTGETIVSTGQTITVEANIAKIPVYLNTASEYAAELQEIFAGDTWTAIKALANANQD